MCKHTVCPGCPSRRFAPPWMYPVAVRLHQLAPGSNRCAQVLRCLGSDGLDVVGPISQRIPLPQQGQAYTGDGGVIGRGALFRMAAVWPPLSPPSTVRSRHENVPALHKHSPAVGVRQSLWSVPSFPRPPSLPDRTRGVRTASPAMLMVADHASFRVLHDLPSLSLRNAQKRAADHHYPFQERWRAHVILQQEAGRIERYIYPKRNKSHVPHSRQSGSPARQRCAHRGSVPLTRL